MTKVERFTFLINKTFLMNWIHCVVLFPITVMFNVQVICYMWNWKINYKIYYQRRISIWNRLKKTVFNSHIHNFFHFIIHIYWNKCVTVHLHLVDERRKNSVYGVNWIPKCVFPCNKHINSNWMIKYRVF